MSGTSSPDTITVKVSGSLLDDEGIATLARALEALGPGWQPVLVHGGGPQLDEALGKLDEPVRRHRGLRVTSRAQAGIVQATLDGVGSDLARALVDHGVESEHVDSLQHALVARTKHLTTDEEIDVDLGRVGEPVRFHVEALPAWPRVPVVTPVGTDGTGPLNVNADEAATAIAQATASTALVFATSVPGVLGPDGRPIQHVGPDEAEALLAAGVACGGMQPKLQAALEALSGGVEAVTVASLSSSMLTDAIAPSPKSAGTRITATGKVIA